MLDRKQIELYNQLLVKRENKIGIHKGIVTIEIQIAAFYAYIGEKDIAKKILQKLLNDNKNTGFLKRRIKEAMIAPTYTPTSKIYLN